MAFITLSTLVTDPFVAALCNTLVHSLWQGLVLAALTGAIIIFTRKASAATRYNLLIAALTLFAVGVSLTFITQLKQANVAAANTVQALPFNNTTPIIINNADVHVRAINTPPADATFSDKLFNYLNHNHNTIVLVWFLIICAKSIQLGFGLWGVNRLKTRQVSVVSEFWNDRIHQLANSLAIKQTISLLESGLIKVPMVIGNLKPVILMPVGLLTALSTAEVEAILVHELAHIKRRDYLVNLLQSLMEIVFFFNPAVLWVSQLIKAERENCCDDLALAQSSDKVSYVRALLTCEEYQQSVPAYAMAFPGGKGSLFNRVKRLTGNRNHSLNLFEKTVLAICLVVSGLCMSAFAEKENIKRTMHEVVKAIQHIKTADAQPQQIAGKPKAIKTPAIQPVNPAVLTAEMPMLNPDTIIKRVDTNSVKDKTITRLKLEIDSLEASMPTTKRLSRINADRKSLGRINTDLDRKDNVNSNIQVNTNTAIKTNVNADVKTNIDAKINTKVDYAYKNNNAILYKPSRVTYSATMPYKPDSANKKAIYKKYPLKLRYKVNGTDSGMMLNLKLNIPNMADALYNAGLIKDKSHYTAMITNDVLMVNGVKQSEANHQKILKLYQKKPNDTVNLSFTYPGK
ncbi:MAG: M56 family metallopeptidase [Bacteroidota bacterium]